MHTVTGNSDCSPNGNVDQSGNGNSNGNGDRNHNDHASSKSDANVNGLGKGDVAIARTIAMVEQSVKKTKTKVITVINQNRRKH